MSNLIDSKTHFCQTCGRAKLVTLDELREEPIFIERQNRAKASFRALLSEDLKINDSFEERRLKFIEENPEPKEPIVKPNYLIKFEEHCNREGLSLERSYGCDWILYGFTNKYTIDEWKSWKIIWESITGEKINE